MGDIAKGWNAIALIPTDDQGYLVNYERTPLLHVSENVDKPCLQFVHIPNHRNDVVEKS